MKEKIINILKVFLIALFASYYASSTFFIHSHVIDGKKVLHSHPYFPSDKHSHSSVSFQLIQQLNNILFIGSVFTAFILLLPLLGTIEFIFLGFSVKKYFFDSFPLRGPPSCSTI